MERKSWRGARKKSRKATEVKRHNARCAQRKKVVAIYKVRRKNIMRRRRVSAISVISVIVVGIFWFALLSLPASVNDVTMRSADDTSHASQTSQASSQKETSSSSAKGATTTTTTTTAGDTAQAVLETLSVKGRAPKTGYERAQFGDGWSETNGCSTRNIILHRDLTNVVLDDECRVVSGTLADPYTGETIQFTKTKSSAVQIDHVVALSNAWQTGAQQLSKAQRVQLANDPLELLAVDGPANQAKSDGDAATWLPKNKAFRCQYIARQIAVKKKYSLWVTTAEKEAMTTVLSGCPNQAMPQV